MDRYAVHRLSTNHTCLLFPSTVSTVQLLQPRNDARKTCSNCTDTNLAGHLPPVVPSWKYAHCGTFCPAVTCVSAYVVAKERSRLYITYCIYLLGRPSVLHSNVSCGCPIAHHVGTRQASGRAFPECNLRCSTVED